MKGITTPERLRELISAPGTVIAFDGEPKTEFRQRPAINALSTDLDEDAPRCGLHQAQIGSPGAGNKERLGHAGAHQASCGRRAFTPQTLPRGHARKAVGIAPSADLLIQRDVIGCRASISG